MESSQIDPGRIAYGETSPTPEVALQSDLEATDSRSTQLYESRRPGSHCMSSQVGQAFGSSARVPGAGTRCYIDRAGASNDIGHS